MSWPEPCPHQGGRHAGHPQGESGKVPFPRQSGQRQGAVQRLVCAFPITLVSAPEPEKGQGSRLAMAVTRPLVEGNACGEKLATLAGNHRAGR